ncbi:uncharacterized protein LOC131031020 isoform X2 [Cryptomeria japonica]|nr:uncharacterized protein LOC131031020 isoform X2 [Cryptomeria japonica]
MHNKSSKDAVIADAENGTEIHEEELIKAVSDRNSEERNEEIMGATSRHSHLYLTDSGEAGEAEPLQDFSAEHLHGTENVGAEHTWPSGQMNSADEQHIHLVNNYYELEKKRQEVLQQLYQLNGWNHQVTNEQATSSMQWSGCGQCGQDASHNSFYPPMQAYSHPYSHCWFDQPLPCMGPCSHCATCSSLGGGLTNNNQPYSHCQFKNSMHSPSMRNTVEPSKTSLAADGLANTILEVVKKATSTVKAEMPRGDDICEGELKIDDSGEGSSNSDITEMLHAWFLAGFSTARYIDRKATEEK